MNLEEQEEETRSEDISTLQKRHSGYERLWEHQRAMRKKGGKVNIKKETQIHFEKLQLKNTNKILSKGVQGNY